MFFKAVKYVKKKKKRNEQEKMQDVASETGTWKENSDFILWKYTFRYVRPGKLRSTSANAQANRPFVCCCSAVIFR